MKAPGERALALKTWNSDLAIGWWDVARIAGYASAGAAYRAAKAASELSGEAMVKKGMGPR